MTFNKHCERWLLPALLTLLSACGGGSSSDGTEIAHTAAQAAAVQSAGAQTDGSQFEVASDGGAITHTNVQAAAVQSASAQTNAPSADGQFEVASDGGAITHTIMQAAAVQSASAQTNAPPAGGQFEVASIDSTSWQTLASPTIPGPLQYSNDHTVIKGGDGNWHVIGINGGGNGSENSFYHTILSSLYPPHPVINTGAYSNLDKNGQAAPVAQFYDKSGNACNAWAPSSINYNGTIYLLFRSDRDNNGNCRRAATRLEILKSTDPTLQKWTPVNTYPTQASPNTPVRFGIVVNGTPTTISTASGPAYNSTGWPTNFRDPGIFRDDDGTFLLYTVTYDASTGHSRVPVYTSTDLLNWTYQGIALTLANGAVEVSWGATESPFVFKRGSWYYLSTTDTDSGSPTYEDTILLRSKNRLNFGTYDGSDLPKSGSNVIERLKVHAPEYVQDDSGNWYITTCGWQNVSSIPQANHGVAIAKLRFSSSVPTDGMQAWYAFEQVTTTIADSSGNGHTGMLVGPAGKSTGVAGQALTLAGSSYASVAPISLAGDFTVDGWVNTTNTPGNHDGLFHTADGYDFNFYGGYPRFYGGSAGDVLVSSLAVPQKTWTHVALTRAGGVMSIYVNGIKTAQGTFGATLNVDGIGRTVAGSLTGALDEVHIYNRALSTLEIANLLQSSAVQSNTSVTRYPLTGDFTLASWVNITRTPSNADELFFGSGGMDVNFYSRLPRLYSGSGDVVVANASVAANMWAHVAVTRQNGALTVYVNGAPTGTGSWRNAFELSQIGEGGHGALQGTLSDVRVQTQALNASQIATLYSQSQGNAHAAWLH
ncbi:LamG-like jellyroll fold domain-containing protein [Paraburkholderia sp. J41]|uniref:LamG-like jellyroll fold domain-containing protein n=1 Tax=Paraburkholderia sp. J41 TaxID=2805433 RepID=UPI002AC3166E|nr:LamG-like jellyroll fold domain-containing protein [Paraburkholderia sp. J41]